MQRSLAELLAFNDRLFVTHAFQAVLGREPNEGEFRHYLDLLRNGRESKTDLICLLRYSPEGQGRGVIIPGLRRHHLLRRITRLPGIGLLAEAGLIVLRLPRLRRHLVHLEAATQADARNLYDEVDEMKGRLHGALDAVRVLQLRVDAALGEQADLVRQIDHLGDNFAASLQTLRRDVGIQEGRLSMLLKALRSPERGGDPDAAAVAELDRHRLDALFADFTDAFRGSYEEVKQGFREYLPVLATAGCGTASMPILEVGCGRGEWLDLMRDEGLVASGVEANQVLAARCQSQGLQVVQAEALAHLQGLPAHSLGAVTAFHAIAQLPLEGLIALLDECLRVIKPGGLLLFETPNPANLWVGRHGYRMDLSQRQPLSAPTAIFLAEARGFVRARTLDLHPTEHMQRHPDQTDLEQALRKAHYGAQDYALIAERP